MRQIVLDTETTGLEVAEQHRIIEIGCVELVNRRPTGRVFHKYLNPERDIDAGAVQVHGLTRERLSSEPTFAAIHAELLEFVRDAELIIHNAPFDVAFLNHELKLLREAQVLLEPQSIEDMCRVVDSLALARRMHPGQRNSLDALCKRYAVDNSHRDHHGALLDARILADVYLAMTGGQAILVLGAQSDGAVSRARARRAEPARGPEGSRIAVVRATPEELAAHELSLTRIDKASGGKTVWRKA
jgi:DNA polymerase-3 subunit epsilon